MITWLAVGIGGFIGAVFRHAFSITLQNESSYLPWGTMAVNILGSVLIGFFMAVHINSELIDEKIKFFLVTGILGGFTTMSAFGHESYDLLEGKETLKFALYVAGTILLVLAGVLLGRATAGYVLE